MDTQTAPEPVHGPPHAIAADETGHLNDAETAPADQAATAMTLDLVELELALDLNDIAAHGFDKAVRDAAKTVNGEFLFDLPASGLAEDAQRIAVVCLSRDEGGRFGLVVLSADGDRATTVEPDETTADLVRFAKAFVAVLEKL